MVPSAKGLGQEEGKQGRTFTKPLTPAVSAASLCVGVSLRLSLPTKGEGCRNDADEESVPEKHSGQEDCAEHVARHRGGPERP